MKKLYYIMMFWAILWSLPVYANQKNKNLENNIPKKIIDDKMKFLP